MAKWQDSLDRCKSLTMPSDKISWVDVNQLKIAKLLDSLVGYKPVTKISDRG